MEMTLHPKSDVVRVYLSREIRKRGLIRYKGRKRMKENNL